jgi:hypothetical protein
MMPKGDFLREYYEYKRSGGKLTMTEYSKQSKDKKDKKAV